MNPQDCLQVLRTLVSELPVVVFECDERGWHTGVNDQWCRLTGLTQTEAMGMGWLRALHPEDRERVTQEWHKAVQSGAELTSEYRYLRADGGIVWVAGRAMPLRGPGGQVFGFLGTAVNITDRRGTSDAPRPGDAALVGASPAAGRSPGRPVAPLVLAPHALVVDDNSVNQKVAARMLAKLGCVVKVAANGREAVDLAREQPLHVIFMDCMMPEMDGYEATAAIRSLPGPEARTPIVAMTANAMQGDRERCLAAGMDDYLSKPVQPEELRAALERWTGLTATRGADRPPPVDAEVLREFQQLQEAGAPDIVAEFIELFLGDLPVRRQAIGRALATGDADAIRAEAHGLKGSAAYIGARELARLCLELENSAHSGDQVAIPRAGAALDDEAERVSEYLRHQQPRA